MSLFAYFDLKKSLISHRHDERRDDRPRDRPVRVWPVPRHLFHTTRELPRPKDPADGDGLEEAHPQDGDAAGAVEVHELEDEGPALRDHGQAQEEE